MSSMFCTKIYRCKNANWCARDFNPKSDEPECFELLTNYDRLISKTPEEFVDFLADLTESGYKEIQVCIPDGAWNIDCGETSCRDYWLEWLKQEAET